MKIKLRKGPIMLPHYIVAVSDSKVVGMYKSIGMLSVSMTRRILKSLHEAASQKKVVEGCTECDGRGYFEYETGVVSEHIPYTKEIAKEPCNCVLEKMNVGGVAYEL